LKDKINHTVARLKLLKKKISFILLIIVIGASAAIMVINYYTIRILSGARSYINGESQYSKGQKDASAHLINYIYLQNETDYFSFEKDISVPIGDRIARMALSSNNDNRDAEKGFLIGKNNRADIDDMVWLFNRFQHLAMFEKAIGIWTDGDAMVKKLHQLGLQSHQRIIGKKISAAEKKSLILSISNISEQLTVKERAFSDTLGAICRTINMDVFIANVLISLIIVVSLLLYFGILIRNLANSKKKIIEQNNSLQLINAGLDKFVFNVTHDLRSPLASLLGLINLVDEENNPTQIKSYTLFMKNSLEKQDQFIHEMLVAIKDKRLVAIKEECNLLNIIDSVIAQNKYRRDGREVCFYKELELHKINSDPLTLKVILNNLVSNSIKYSDTKKPEQWVRVKTHLAKVNAVIEVEDNGVGIKKADQQRIFDEFYQSGDNKRSSGVGLYLVKDAVTKLNGSIEVKSEPGLYSKFIISIPC
jgi:signal transduction histidine kinase